MSATEDGVSHWRQIAIGGGAAMFTGIALGRFTYTTMVPPLIQSGQLTELEAGYVGGANLACFFFGAYYAEKLRRALSIRLLVSCAVWLALLALAASLSLKTNWSLVRNPVALGVDSSPVNL